MEREKKMRKDDIDERQTVQWSNLIQPVCMRDEKALHSGCEPYYSAILYIETLIGNGMYMIDLC